MDVGNLDTTQCEKNISIYINRRQSFCKLNSTIITPLSTPSLLANYLTYHSSSMLIGGGNIIINPPIIIICRLECITAAIIIIAN